MRLYLNDKEAKLIRASLNASYPILNQDCKESIHRIIDRMDLCDKLQNSERRAKANDN